MTTERLTCERFAELSIDALETNLTAAAAESFAAHRETCAECRAEFEELTRTWRDLGDVAALDGSTEVPTDRLRRGVDQLIAAERAKRVLPFAPRAASTSRPPIAAWLAGIAAALFAGLWLGARLQGTGADTRALQAELGSLRQMVALSMLQKPEASERLEGVRYGSHIARPGSDVVHTLFEVVRTDANVNVRLAAVEALSARLGQATAPGRTVSDELLAAFDDAASPLVQAAIAASLLDEPTTRAAAERRFTATLAEGKLDPSVAAFLRRRLGVSA